MATMAATLDRNYQTLLADLGTSSIRERSNPKKHRILDSTRGESEEPAPGETNAVDDHLYSLIEHATISTAHFMPELYDAFTDVTSLWKTGSKSVAELLWHSEAWGEFIDEVLLIDDDKLPSNTKSTRYVSAKVQFVEAKPRLMPDPEAVWYD